LLEAHEESGAEMLEEEEILHVPVDGSDQRLEESPLALLEAHKGGWAGMLGEEKLALASLKARCMVPTKETRKTHFSK
jgi:hypothetical protein